MKIEKFYWKILKIEFNLASKVQNKNIDVKNIKISGYIIPSTLKVNFEEIIFDNNAFTEKKIKNYEEKFKYEVINNSLSNVFNEQKIRNFLKAF